MFILLSLLNFICSFNCHCLWFVHPFCIQSHFMMNLQLQEGLSKKNLVQLQLELKGQVNLRLQYHHPKASVEKIWTCYPCTVIWLQMQWILRSRSTLNRVCCWGLQALDPDVQCDTCNRVYWPVPCFLLNFMSILKLPRINSQTQVF
jgi:hypothetical protein